MGEARLLERIEARERQQAIAKSRETPAFKGLTDTGEKPEASLMDRVEERHRQAKEKWMQDQATQKKLDEQKGQMNID